MTTNRCWWCAEGRAIILLGVVMEDFDKQSTCALSRSLLHQSQLKALVSEMTKVGLVGEQETNQRFLNTPLRVHRTPRTHPPNGSRVRATDTSLTAKGKAQKPTSPEWCLLPHLLFHPLHLSKRQYQLNLYSTLPGDFFVVAKRGCTLINANNSLGQ